MFQGFERPPWWAVGVMVLSTAFLAIALPIAVDRGRVSPAELAAAESSAPAPSATPSPSTTSSAAEGPAEPADEGRIQIAALGDAYTGGSAMDSGEGFRWHELLTERNPWDITPYTVGGAGFVAGREQGLSFPDRVGQIVAAAPDVVVVAGGQADIGASPPEVEAAVDATLDELRSGLPEARILVVGVLWPGTAPAPAFGLSRALQASADRIGATFVDPLNGGWFDGVNRLLIGPDGTYPTDAGQAALADRIEAALVAAGVPNQV